MTIFSDDRAIMLRAVTLAERGVGFVEPNPAVGAVIVAGNRRLLAEGWHARFGGPHAEAMALAAAGTLPTDATLFCTLEPCSHFGKTPPCADAIIAAGIRRVVVALRDPAPHVNGAGITRMRAAGIQVDVGLCAEEARAVTAPFLKLITQQRPYVHAKWAMSADGKIATANGRSQWISGAESRAEVHRLRGRMDVILTGIGTVLADDPLLTARPAGPRQAVRVVVDSLARLPLTSQLVRTAAQTPVLAVVSAAAPVVRIQALRDAGVEVLIHEPEISLPRLLDELGAREQTNVFVEAGGRLLGSLFDANLLDCCHIFIAPKILGGASAPGPIGGRGSAELQDEQFVAAPPQQFGSDTYLRLTKRDC